MAFTAEQEEYIRWMTRLAVYEFDLKEAMRRMIRWSIASFVMLPITIISAIYQLLVTVGAIHTSFDMKIAALITQLAILAIVVIVGIGGRRARKYYASLIENPPPSDDSGAK